MPRWLRTGFVLFALALSVSGCEACDQAKKTVQQVQEGRRQVEQAQQEAKQTARDAKAAASAAKNAAGNASGEANAALNQVADHAGGSDSCTIPSPDANQSTTAFANTFAGIATKDVPAAQGLLGAINVIDVGLFFHYLSKLAASNDLKTQMATSCMLDRFYSLVPSYHDQLEVLVSETSAGRTSNWYELSPSEKVRISRTCVAGNPLCLTITRSIQAKVPTPL